MANKHPPQIPFIAEQLRQSGEDFDLLTIQDLQRNTEWLQKNFSIAFFEETQMVLNLNQLQWNVNDRDHNEKCF